jgi:hypothetical protein
LARDDFAGLVTLQPDTAKHFSSEPPLKRIFMRREALSSSHFANARLYNETLGAVQMITTTHEIRFLPWITFDYELYPSVLV